MKRKTYLIGFCAAVILIFVGWLGHAYHDFRATFGEKISMRDIVAAEKIYSTMESSRAFWFFSMIPIVRDDFILSKAWVAAQLGDYAEALKQYRKLADGNMDAAYNAATIALAIGQVNSEKIAAEYIRILQKNPDDFRARVNLEIIKMVQEQQKQKGKSIPGDGDGQEKVKKYRPGDKDGSGRSRGNQDLRY